ncbi:MAG: protein kinase [Proteobacteria bacterium]|nr:protein kinase [Pseudomonadota bacterium]
MLERIGNCRITGELGSGGTAVIYKAVQEPLGRTVAIKALKPSIARDSEFAERFEREARFMASLQHENILHVYDFVKQDQSTYIVMEYVRGIDLRELLAQCTCLPVDVAAIVALQVARALDHAHFRGIIHRDIKPANIIISRSGEVKLMDFGVAGEEAVSGHEGADAGVGTPSYMSPEQVLGDKLDARSDVFSLGIVLYQCVTGTRPFEEDAGRTAMQRIRLDRYVRPRRVVTDVPRGIERLMARCMEKLPARRYQTTQSLIHDLQDFLAPRVSINYSARLVMFLRDAQLIGSIEADETLANALSRSARSAGYNHGLLRSTAVVFGALFLGVVLSGGAIQAAHGGLGANDSVGAPLVLERAGYLRFVVQPWAEVHIDGHRVCTTPSARTYPVAPGRHYLKLSNPHLGERHLELTIKAGEIKLVDVKLEAKVSKQPATQTGG